MRTRPSYAVGFARYAADSMAPELWRGLIWACCPFLGNTGFTTVRDWSGYNNHGIISGTIWNSHIYGPTLDFDGIDDNVAFPHTQTDYPAISVSAWLKSDVNDVRQCIVGSVVEDSRLIWHVEVGHASGGIGAYLKDGLGGSETVFSLIDHEVGAWEHVCMTFDADNVDLFRNGLNIKNQNPGINSVSVTGIDLGDLATNEFNGQLSQIQIWDRKITHYEVNKLYREPFAMWELADIPYTIAPVVTNNLLLLTQSNLRGNLQVLDGGL